MEAPLQLPPGVGAVILLIAAALTGCDSEKARVTTVTAGTECQRLLLGHAPACGTPEQARALANDSWGRPLQCVVQDGHRPAIVSLGKDGVTGGHGANADISCFPKDQACFCNVKESP